MEYTMRSDISRWCGVAGGTLAALAVAASVWAALLPYRISQMQGELLDTAVLLQLAGPICAALCGSAALSGDVRSRRLGFIALTLSGVAFGFLAFTSNVHSISHF